MDTVSYRDIKDLKIGGENITCVTATVMNRSKMRSWARNNSSGKMITGVLGDDTGYVDFVAWSEAAEIMDAILLKGKTFTLKNIKLTTSKQQYASTQNPCQVIINKKTTIVEETGSAALTPPLAVTPIKY